MPLGKVEAAQRIPAVIPETTVPGIGEHGVLALVIADPTPAALGLCQLLRFSAQTTSQHLFWPGLLPLSRELLV